MHQVTLTLGVLGYSLILMLFLAAPALAKHSLDMVTETGVLLLFYGLYYGLLGRDLAEYCVDNMSATFKVPNSKADCNIRCRIPYYRKLMLHEINANWRNSR